jgi:type II secretory pathway component PulK
VVLLIVLVVIVALSLSAYTFSDLMLANRHATLVNGKRLQTRYCVESGVESIKMFLRQDIATQTDAGGCYDNPLYFQARAVLPNTDLKSRGSFSVLASLFDDTGLPVGVRFGLEDESARLNLNVLLAIDEASAQLSSALEGLAGSAEMGGAAAAAASAAGNADAETTDAAMSSTGRTLLMGLPGMTEDVADAILDWMDSDDEPREYGAELDYYASMNPPYKPRNAPLQTVEELLLVRGVTPQMLFGLDTNHNGLVDTHEMTTAGTGPNTTTMAASTAAMATNSATSLASGSIQGLSESGVPLRGWSAYLTLYSAEKNVRSDGQPRIDLNQEDLQQLHDQLVEVFSEEWADFIVAYRLYGPTTQSGTTEPEAASDLELDLSQSPKAKFQQVLDLIGATVQLPQQGGQQGGQQSGQNTPQRTIASPFANDVLSMATYLPLLSDTCTAVAVDVIPGRINVNTAPREILLGVPGMSEEIVDQILSSRSQQTTAATSSSTSTNDGTTAGSTGRESETWLLGEGLVTLDEMRQFSPFLCAGGDVYRAQIVGYFQGGGPSTRCEVVIDATDTEPRVLFWRDISHLGRGFPLELLGVDLMQAM